MQSTRRREPVQIASIAFRVVQDPLFVGRQNSQN